MNQEPRTDLERAAHWLSGEIRISRKIALAAGLFLLVLVGVALD